MAQDGYDTLLNLTDSRYRLSIVVARRAAQLKSGVPSLLSDDEMPDAASNTVTVAMEELIRGKEISWGEDLPNDASLRDVRARQRREERSDEL